MVTSKAYTDIKYGKMSLSLGFLVIVGLSATLYMTLNIFSERIPVDLTRVSTLTTFLYGFFAFSFLSYIQTKFIEFKSASGIFFTEVKNLYMLARATGQETCINNTRAALKDLLLTMHRYTPNDYEISMEKIEKIYEALDSVDTKRSKHTNYHFAMSLRITDITKSLERIHIFGRRYLTGELKVMFLAFTALFVIVMGTLAMQDVYSLISAIVLATIVVFSVFYIFHLDGFTYSEQTILDNKITDLLNYLEGDNQVSVG